MRLYILDELTYRRARATLCAVLILCSLLSLQSLGLWAQGGAVYNERTGEQYASIQEAIYNARSGDTILVYPGTYYESLRVTDSLTLRGLREGGKAPVLAPPGQAPAITLSSPSFDNEMTVDGFDIETSVIDYAIIVERTTANVRNNRIKGAGYGVAVRTYVPLGLHFESNEVRNFAQGVLGENKDDRPVSDMRIRDNLFEEMREAVSLTYCPTAVVEGNTMRNTPDPSRDGTSAAITLISSPNAFVARNRICTFHFGVYSAYGDGAVIESNRIERDMDTAGSGIYLINGSDFSVNDNEIVDVVYAMTFDAARRAVLRGNSFEDSEYGLYNYNPDDTQFLVDAQDNWWGSSDGPSVEGRRTGVPVTRNILYDPWLTNSPPFDDHGCK